MTTASIRFRPAGHRSAGVSMCARPAAGRAVVVAGVRS
jgi:hypothetical protein